MNEFIINENKRLKLCTKTKWYVGESDFEKIVVTMPSVVSGNDMSEWITDARLYAVRDGLAWYRTLEFTLDDDTYTSQEIDVDSAWCLKEGEVTFYVQFSDGEDLGKTNTVTVEILPSEDESILYDGFATEVWVQEQLEAKQDVLVSGTNIKTINGTSILGEGDLEIEGVSDYTELENKPQINSVELTGNKSLSDIGVPISDISANTEARHTHSNIVILDQIDMMWVVCFQRVKTYFSNWQEAYSNMHTHDNKSVLDGISSAKVTSWDSKQDALTIATSESTTEGQVYDVTYINSIIGDIESLLSEV